jgi:1-acyl-sn-glycerol-3-phosphate acyltransferase
VWGIGLIVDGEPSSAQAVYVINHTSTLDLFIIVALGLPRTRIFMRGWTRKFLPRWLIAKLIGVFWTVPQERQAERVRIFQRADRILRRTGDSVLLSPEGKRVTSGEIGHFNKGAFHLATSLRAPLIPIYIGIPRTMNPGVGYTAGSGTVTARFLPAIATDAWRLSDLEQNIASVRDVFVGIHSEQSRPLTAAAV